MVQWWGLIDELLTCNKETFEHLQQLISWTNSRLVQWRKRTKALLPSNIDQVRFWPFPDEQNKMKFPVLNELHVSYEVDSLRKVFQESQEMIVLRQKSQNGNLSSLDAPYGDHAIESSHPAALYSTSSLYFRQYNSGFFGAKLCAPLDTEIRHNCESQFVMRCKC